MGPSMVAFLKEVYGRAKEAEKFLMPQQPALKNTWNTMVASSFWDMRLSVACAATDAEYPNRISLHANTLNLPVVARQPHTGPCATLCGAPRCRRLKTWRVIVPMSGARSSMKPLVPFVLQRLPRVLYDLK